QRKTRIDGIRDKRLMQRRRGDGLTALNARNRPPAGAWSAGLSARRFCWPVGVWRIIDASRADRMRDDSHERYNGPSRPERRRYFCPKIFRRGFGSRGGHQPAVFSDLHLFAADVRDRRRLRHLAGKLTPATVSK